MFMGILCRFCRCFAGRPRERELSAKPTGDAVGEARAEAEGQAPGQGAEGVIHDLTANPGIGIVMQDRLNRAGITNYAQLARPSPNTCVRRWANYREAPRSRRGSARRKNWRRGSSKRQCTALSPGFPSGEQPLYCKPNCKPTERHEPG